MASIRLKLRKDAKDKDGNFPIVLVYQKGRKETIFSIGKNTPAEYFTGNQTNPLSGGTEYKTANIHIRNLFAKLQGIADGFFMTNGEYPNNEWVKLQWNTKNTPKLSVFDYFDMFMTSQQTRGVNSVSYGTATNYKITKAKLIEYELYSGHPITFESFNENFADKFSHYLLKHQDMLPSSVGEKLKIIKTFLNYCIKQGVRISLKDIKSFKGATDKTWKLYLTLEDLNKLAVAETIYSETKDAFLLQSCLGVRYSDLKTIVQEKIIKDGAYYFYVTKTVKTNKQIKVRLIDLAKEVLERRIGTQWIPTNNQMNTELKLIFKNIGGFNEIIEVSQGSGTFKKVTRKPKHEFISTHTARISFINIMRKLNVDDSTISAITGQSLSTLIGYYHNSDGDISEAMDRLNLAI